MKGNREDQTRDQASPPLDYMRRRPSAVSPEERKPESEAGLHNLIVMTSIAALLLFPAPLAEASRERGNQVRHFTSPSFLPQEMQASLQGDATE